MRNEYKTYFIGRCVMSSDNSYKGPFLLVKGVNDVGDDEESLDFGEEEEEEEEASSERSHEDNGDDS